MAFIKKEWKNRLVEFAGRRKLTRVAGSIENEIVVDVIREEGTVSQQGDAFSEANMNDLEQRIEDGFNDTIDKNNILDKEEVEANTEAGKYVADALVVKEINDSLGGFTPIIDPETGQITGYKTKVGADTVYPFRCGSKDIPLELKSSYNQSIIGQPNLTTESMINASILDSITFNHHTSVFDFFICNVYNENKNQVIENIKTYPQTVDLSSYDGNIIIYFGTGATNNSDGKGISISLNLTLHLK